MLGQRADFRDLRVHAKAHELAREVFAASELFPRGEMYTLTQPLRQSSRAIADFLEEAWDRLPNESGFCAKLEEAESAQRDLRHWIGVAQEHGLLTGGKAARSLRLCLQISRQLRLMISESRRFCGPPKDIRRDARRHFLC